MKNTTEEILLDEEIAELIIEKLPTHITPYKKYVHLSRLIKAREKELNNDEYGMDEILTALYGIRKEVYESRDDEYWDHDAEWHNKDFIVRLSALEIAVEHISPQDGMRRSAALCVYPLEIQKGACHKAAETLVNISTLHNAVEGIKNNLARKASE